MEHDHMVQTLAPDGADQALDEWILPGERTAISLLIWIGEPRFRSTFSVTSMVGFILRLHVQELQRMTARSITFCNSRTLPGQS
jgi:hypothetical protein